MPAMGKNAAVADDEVQSVADSPEIPGRDSSCAPSPRGWLSSLLLAAGDLTGWLYTAGGCGVVVDLASVAEQAAARWELLRSPTPDRQGVSQADPSTDQ